MTHTDYTTTDGRGRLRLIDGLIYGEFPGDPIAPRHMSESTVFTEIQALCAQRDELLAALESVLWPELASQDERTIREEAKALWTEISNAKPAAQEEPKP